MKNPRSARALPQDYGGYLFRFAAGETSVTCLVSEMALNDWLACHAMHNLAAVRRHARRIVESHLRGRARTQDCAVAITRTGLGWLPLFPG
ncbi:MAG: hypothetical protein JNL12_18170 [Planctomycetes bacterium]|nr:hypothetical protein [Planctomycetota bacterium]